MCDVLRLRLKELLQTDRGQALVVTALGLMMLLLMAALGLDVGYLRYQKQQMQKAADAGAIAGATALAYSGDYVNAAINDVRANGFDNNNDVTVTVNNPPQTPGDPFLGNLNYVEVIVSQSRPTFFLRVNGITSVTVRSRAVANAQGNASGCLYALDPTGSGTFTVDSGVNLSTTCGIYVNSSDTAALVDSGTATTIVSESGVGIGGVGIGVAGSYAGSGFQPTPTVGIPQFTDPLGTVPALSTPAACINMPPQNYNYTPSAYCGINLQPGKTYTFAAGTYIILGGGMNVPNSTVVTGTGVTFYVTYDASHGYAPVTIGNNSQNLLSAPTSGPLRGILFFQDRTVISPMPSTFDSSLGATITGALYFPTTKVQFKGTPSGVPSYSPIVAWQIEFEGSSTMKANFLPNDGSPIPGATLVE